MSLINVNKIAPSTGTQVTLGDSGDDFEVPSGAEIQILSGGTLTIDSGATIANSGTATGFPSTTPNFHTAHSSQSIANNSATVVVYTGEDWDTNSLYDTSNGRFTVTSSTTGYYMMYASVGFANLTADRIQVRIKYNNGSSDFNWLINEIQCDSSGYVSPFISGCVPLLSSGHYAFVEAYQNSGGAISLSGEQEKNFFGGFKIG